MSYILGAKEFSLFDSVLFSQTLLFFNKKYGLFDFKGESTKNCESVRKCKFVTKIFFSDNIE